jgi:energy-coupling factor transport system ATP-binding protein
VTIELRGFGWRHAGRRAWAVRGVDLRIERGERVLLLGPSGAGKSTLLAALAGLLAEDSGEQEGELRVDGRAGIVFQDPQAQIVMARSGDDVAFGCENTGVPAAEIWPRVDEALGLVGFGYPRDRPTQALSGGEAQRLALAGALALRPDVLLLDEPTANLDPPGAASVRQALRRAVAGGERSLVLVEHRLAEVVADDLVDRVVVLEPGGGVVADGPPDQVFAAHGASLAERGVWVPGQPLPHRPAARPAGPVLLTADQLGFRYPGATSAALTGLDLSVRAGEALAIRGPNGTGKSTLALMLGGLVPPTSGRLVAGAELAAGQSGPPHRWAAKQLAARIGSVFQNPEHQFVTSRVDEELALGPRRAGQPPERVRSTVDELLSRLHLEKLAAANPYTLSGGEQRRLSVATALATAPRLLVLDEPTFGQDRRTWIELVELLATLRDEGAGVVAVTHDEDFATALADRTVTLGDAVPVVPAQPETAHALR